MSHFNLLLNQQTDQIISSPVIPISYPTSVQQNLHSLHTVAQPILQQNVHPLHTVAQPILQQNVHTLQPVVKPILQQNVHPLQPVVEPILQQNVHPLQPVVEPILQQNVHPLQSVVEPILQQNVHTLQPVVEPILQHNVHSLHTVAQPILQHNVHPLQPVVQPVLKKNINQNLQPFLKFINTQNNQSLIIDPSTQFSHSIPQSLEELEIQNQKAIKQKLSERFQNAINGNIQNINYGNTNYNNNLIQNNVLIPLNINTQINMLPNTYTQYNNQFFENLNIEAMPGGLLNQRYQLIKLLGKGSFGKVFKSFDMLKQKFVALKIIMSNQPISLNQSQIEKSILEELNNYDKNKNHIVRLIDDFMWNNHKCMAFELLQMNLFEMIQNTNGKGLDLLTIKVISSKLLRCLSLLYDCNIIHCDLKPENIMIANKCEGYVKLVDFGSSCKVGGQIYSYIQSRFYRAPEVILELNYSKPIDIWSLGCLLAELSTCEPLFCGKNEYEQMAYIVQYFGIPPNHMITSSKKFSKFFIPNNYGSFDFAVNNSINFSGPCTKSLNQFLQKNKQFTLNIPQGLLFTGRDSIDDSFENFIYSMLNYNPDRRANPYDLMIHPFIFNVICLHLDLPKNITKFNINSIIKHVKNNRFKNNTNDDKSNNQNLDLNYLNDKINANISSFQFLWKNYDINTFTKNVISIPEISQNFFNGNLNNIPYNINLKNNNLNTNVISNNIHQPFIQNLHNFNNNLKNCPDNNIFKAHNLNSIQLFEQIMNIQSSDTDNYQRSYENQNFIQDSFYYSQPGSQNQKINCDNKIELSSQFDSFNNNFVDLSNNFFSNNFLNPNSTFLLNKTTQIYKN